MSIEKQTFLQNQEWDFDELTAKVDEKTKNHILEWLVDTPFLEERTELPKLPKGVIGYFLPSKKLVISGPRFVYGVINTIISSLAVVATGGNPFVIIVGGMSVADAINKIKSSFQKLSENQGEFCSYAAIHEVGWYAFPMHQLAEVRISDVWDVHQENNKSCPVTTCVFHGKRGENGCGVTRNEFGVIIEKLQEKKLVVSDGNFVRAKL